MGAIAILIVEVGIRHGFRPAFVAGAGAATADFLYSGLAVIGGATWAGTVRAFDTPLRIVSGLVLIVIAIVGLCRVGHVLEEPDQRTDLTGTGLARTYARFLGLTIINPTTIVYFAAVIIGLGVADGMTSPRGSCSWSGPSWPASPGRAWWQPSAHWPATVSHLVPETWQ